MQWSDVEWHAGGWIKWSKVRGMQWILGGWSKMVWGGVRWCGWSKVVWDRVSQEGWSKLGRVDGVNGNS